MSKTQSLPFTTDTALADLYNAAAAQRSIISTSRHSLIQMAGAEFYYRRRQRVTDMTFEQAMERITAELKNHEPDATYGLLNAPCSPRSNIGSVRRSLAKLDEATAELARIHADMAPLEAVYEANGWSRFFLVTSSPGHIHSSMSCSTCRLTTTYGWLPELSGKTEAEAVAAHGPALCSVCFPSAPTEWVGGKITAAKAARAAH